MAVEHIIMAVLKPAGYVQHKQIADKRRFVRSFDFLTQPACKIICLIDAAELKNNQGDIGEQIRILLQNMDKQFNFVREENISCRLLLCGLQGV